jgi:hypothetical protein
LTLTGIVAVTLVDELHVAVPQQLHYGHHLREIERRDRLGGMIAAAAQKHAKSLKD